jgi:hypothetical protein
MVQGSAVAIQADAAPAFLQLFREDLTGELRPLVRVADLRLSLLQRLVQCDETTQHVHRD